MSPTGLGNLQTGRRGEGWDGGWNPSVMTRARHRVLFARRTSSDIITCKYRRYFRPAIDFRSSIQARLVPGTDVYGEIALQIVDARSPSTHRDIGRSIDYGSPATIHQEARVCASTCTSFSVSLPPFAADDRVKGACLPAHVEATYVARFFPPTSWTRFVFRFWCIVFQIAERTIEVLIERRFKVYQNKKCSMKNSIERTRNLR